MKEKAEKKPKKKRGISFYMLMAFLLLIIVGGTIFAMDYDNLKQHIPLLADAKETKDEPKELDKLKDSMGDENEESPEVIDDEMDADPDTEVIDEVGCPPRWSTMWGSATPTELQWGPTTRRPALGTVPADLVGNSMFLFEMNVLIWK